MITGNTNSTNGGGITYSSSGSLTISQCEIRGNSATGGSHGGGIHHATNNTLTISQSTISGNTAAGSGGGISCTAGGGTTNIINSTISGNTGEYYTGGVRTDGTFNISHSTIAGNTVQGSGNYGGGIYIGGGTLNMQNTIVADNTGDNGDLKGTVTAGDYNLVEDASDATLSGTHNVTGQDPKLMALADNGGVTKTHALQAGSPALDTGTIKDLTDADVTVDQRDKARPQNGTADIGAFESTTYDLAVTLAGTGGGEVTATGIDCGSDCDQTYIEGTQVTLTADPADYSTFTGWSGDCTGTGNCTLTMSENKDVTATFNLASYTLTVQKTGEGDGTVTSNPVGINCGTDCTQNYNGGTQVTLTADPDDSSLFAGWSGGGCSGTGTCVVTMTAAKTVTADFDAAQGPAPSANAGDSQTVAESTTVTLDGSLSSDVYSDRTIASYQWEQTGGSPTVTLARANTAQAHFVAPAVTAAGTILTFELTVTDDGGRTDTDDVQVTVTDNAQAVTGAPEEAYTVTTEGGSGAAVALTVQGEEGVTAAVTSLETIDPATLTTPEGQTAPSADDLPYGVLSFEVAGDQVGFTAQVVVYLPEAAPADMGWVKYSATDGWYDYSDNVTFNADRTQVTITLVDGGIGDHDGEANGVIDDPSGLGRAPEEVAPTGSGGGSTPGCFVDGLFR